MSDFSQQPPEGLDGLLRKRPLEAPSVEPLTKRLKNKDEAFLDQRRPMLTQSHTSTQSQHHALAAHTQPVGSNFS